MALIKSFQTPTGIAANYWRIKKVSYNGKSQDGYIDKNLKILVEGYVSEEARQNGAKPLDERWIWIPFYGFPSNKNLLTVLYQILKTDPTSEFSDAESDDVAQFTSPITTAIEE